MLFFQSSSIISFKDLVSKFTSRFFRRIFSKKRLLTKNSKMYKEINIDIKINTKIDLYFLKITEQKKIKMKVIRIT